MTMNVSFQNAMNKRTTMGRNNGFGGVPLRHTHHSSSRFLFRVVCTRSTWMTPGICFTRVTASSRILFDLGMLYKWTSSSEPTGPLYASEGCTLARLEGLVNIDVSWEKVTDK